LTDKDKGLWKIRVGDIAGYMGSRKGLKKHIKEGYRKGESIYWKSGEKIFRSVDVIKYDKIGIPIKSSGKIVRKRKVTIEHIMGKGKKSDDIFWANWFD